VIRSAPVGDPVELAPRRAPPGAPR
jgi:hypothetical protein